MGQISYNDPQGSNWRRWDLHIHSPFSELNNGFGDDFDKYVQEVFKKAIEDGIAVIGITDYFTIEGYKKIKNDYLGNQEKLEELFSKEEISKISEILVLPNIEFRLNTLVDQNRVNYHVIFSDKVPIDDIEEDFLHELEFVSEGNPQDEDERWKLKLRNLQELGKRLKLEHKKFEGDSDLFVGMKCAVVDDKKITELLRTKKSKFSGKYILVVPSDEDLSELSWDGQGHNVRKVLIQKSDALFASNQRTINWALGGNDEEAYVKEFKSIKGTFWGSDAHEFDKLFKPDLDRFCWVKADPTFEGLKQALIEPKSRIFIGEKPQSIIRVANHPTKYIDSLAIEKKSESTLDETWFENSSPIPINSGLVAVIGNKGNGKSALADIIGLLGNSHNEESFSFLHKDKFRKPRPNRSDSFSGSLTWINGYVDELGLSESVDVSKPEKVKYLPQNHLEKLCTTTDETEFEQELKKVIFSHIDESERLNKDTLEELLDYRSEEINQRIDQIKIDLNNINKKITSLEDKNHPDYLAKLKESLKAKEEEIKAHNEIKPKEVKEPEKDENLKQEVSQIAEQIKTLISEQEGYEKEIEKLKQQKASELLVKTELIKLKDSFSNFIESFEKLKQNSQSVVQKYSLQFDSILSLSYDFSVIEQKISDSETKLSEIDNQLNPEIKTSTAFKKAECEVKLADLKNKLDAPSKKYQEYLDALKVWENQLRILNGNKETPNTKAFFEDSISYIETSLASDLDTIKNERIEKVKKIIHEKTKLKDLYKSIYSPITKFIQQYGEIVDDYQINLDVSLKLTNFSDKFFNFISQGSKGTFIGKEDGNKKLREILNENGFESEESIIQFLNTIIGALENDLRADNDSHRYLKNQLRQGFEPEEFYAFLFGLEYLEPTYKLKLSDKEVSQLSPGERGALLLIFYLLLDNQDIPLIIDQPEENLDNQSVYKILVRFIKEAKKNRQIIIVTHNPNLAVVCDADQVIHVKIDKADKNKVTVLTGSLENESINEKVIEILEGTFPAFHNRTLKYKLHHK